MDFGSVDWSQMSRRNFPYTIRQKPGPKNALGRVKFIFPNKHNIYLHDTPSRSLFARSTRAFGTLSGAALAAFEQVSPGVADVGT